MPVIESVTVIDGNEMPLYIEAERLPAVLQEDGYYQDTLEGEPGRILGKVGDVFDDGLQLVVRCAAKAAHTIANIAEDVRPQEFEIELSVKLDSEVGAVLAKASAGAHMTVTLRWSKKPG